MELSWFNDVQYLIQLIQIHHLSTHGPASDVTRGAESKIHEQRHYNNNNNTSFSGTGRWTMLWSVFFPNWATTSLNVPTTCRIAASYFDKSLCRYNTLTPSCTIRLFHPKMGLTHSHFSLLLFLYVLILGIFTTLHIKIHLQRWQNKLLWNAKQKLLVSQLYVNSTKVAAAIVSKKQQKRTHLFGTVYFGPELQQA